MAMDTGIMRAEYISSLQNEKLKRTVSLREAKYRKRLKQFLIEGRREIQHALKQGFEFTEVYFCESLVSGNADSEQMIEDLELLSAIKRTLPNCHSYKLSEKAFTKLAVREHACSLVVVCQQPAVQRYGRQALAELLQAKKEPAFLLIVEGIEKPGNMGALFRTADGVGVDAIVALGTEKHDFFNPHAIRASLGSVFTVPSYSVSLVDLKKLGMELGIAVFAAALSENSQLWSEVNYCQPCAILLGTEAFGLTQEALSIATHQIILPMQGRMDSLNVANAASAILYEAVRQRLLACGSR